MTTEMVIILFIGIALVCAILFFIIKKNAGKNTSGHSQQFNQPQNKMPHGQQFQGQQSQGQQSGKFCYNCGKQIEVEAVFCPFCGAPQNAQQAGKQ